MICQAGPFQIEFDFGIFTWPTTSPGTLGSDDRVEVLISRDGGVTWNGLANYNNNYITAPNGNHEIIPLTMILVLFNLPFGLLKEL